MKVFKLALLAVIFLGCNQTKEIEEVTFNVTHEKAVAVVAPTEGSTVTGTVHFSKVADGVSVKGEFSGLSEGKHGFHIHQYGDCTASDGTSAGGHFNPFDKQHSNPESDNRHMGDMGNISADASGKAMVSYVDGTINIEQIIGRGVVVHGGEDDLSSQPSGAAGPRMACGVIGITK